MSESRGGKRDGGIWQVVAALAGVALVIVTWLGIASSQHFFPFGSGSTTTPAGGSSGSAGAPPSNTTAPSIYGALKVGGTVTCSPGQWSGSPTAYTYEWNQASAVKAGATERSYTVTSGDAGQSLTCTVTAQDAAGRTASSTSAAVTVPTPTPQPPQVVWQHEFTFAFNASYGFDSFPPSRTDSVNGFGVETTYTGSSNDIAFTNVGGNQAAQWTGKGRPSFAQCQDALASGGTGVIVIGPTGLSPGGWICGQTDSGLIARLRYDSGIEANSYTFFVTVWKPSQQ